MIEAEIVLPGFLYQSLVESTRSPVIIAQSRLARNHIQSDASSSHVRRNTERVNLKWAPFREGVSVLSNSMWG
jgi:hypothetical protein